MTRVRLKRFIWETSTISEQQERIKMLLDLKVIKKKDPNSCWGWNGGVSTHGYGRISIGGAKYTRNVNAHRAMWLATHGAIPEGYIVCHTCDNRICCNPSHLYLGTHKQNTRDMIKRGRKASLTGEECPWSKLTEKQVLEMLEMFKQGHNCGEVGRKFGISAKSASEIKRGRRWPYVGDRSGIPIIKANKRRLNKKMAIEIKKDLKKGLRVSDIAKQYNVPRSTIDDIKKGNTWKDVGEF